jgi:F420-dependent oxidoreductase-like protein
MRQTPGDRPLKDLVIGVQIATRDVREAIDGILAADAAGVDVAWMTCGGVAPDPLAIYAAAAPRTQRIEFGTSIMPIFPRHPLALAQTALVVNALAPGRLRLGIGPSHEPAMRNVYGFDFARPLEYLREYVTILTTLFSGEPMRFHGRRLHAETQLPAPAGIRVMVSALRHNAFALAGEHAAGGISWVTPPEHIRDVAIPALREGARKAGRDVPPAVVHVPVVVSSDEDAVWEQASTQLANYPRLPFYQAMWVEAGYPEAASGEFSRAMFDGLVVHGDEEAVAERLRGLAAFGASEIIASPLPLRDDPGAAPRTVRLLGQLAREA